MTQVVLELRDSRFCWVEIGSVAEADPPGSISSDDSIRQVYMFGWFDGEVGVWQSRVGVDIENSVFRTIIAAQLDLLSDLSEPFELTITRGPTKVQRRLRFTQRP